jgi:uncharacterized protein (TIGR02246 family)
MPVVHDVKHLYQMLLERWNQRDAAGYGTLFTDDGSMVAFDGSCLASRAAIVEHLGAIFADHDPATYVAKVVEVRPLSPGSVLLRSAVGMLPRGDDIDPDKIGVQALVAIETAQGWRIAHFQTTPAVIDGRPGDASRSRLNSAP